MYELQDFNGSRRGDRFWRTYADVVTARADRAARQDTDLGGMHRIISRLARRDEIPDNWWTSAGLSRNLRREPTNWKADTKIGDLILLNFLRICCIQKCDTTCCTIACFDYFQKLLESFPWGFGTFWRSWLDSQTKSPAGVYGGREGRSDNWWPGINSLWWSFKWSFGQWWETIELVCLFLINIYHDQNDLLWSDLKPACQGTNRADRDPHYMYGWRTG